MSLLIYISLARKYEKVVASILSDGRDYISTKTLSIDPQKHLQKNYFLIRKVIFSTNFFLSFRKFFLSFCKIFCLFVNNLNFFTGRQKFFCRKNHLPN
jgi:hypothetical protein